MSKTNGDDLLVTGWDIESSGDPTVGIFRAHWQLDGDMHFDDLEHKEEFRDALMSAFELVCGEPVTVLTREEQRSIIDMEDRMMQRPSDEEQ